LSHQKYRQKKPEMLSLTRYDDDCCIITLREIMYYLASKSGVVCVVCSFADDEKLKNIHVDLALLI